MLVKTQRLTAKGDSNEPQQVGLLLALPDHKIGVSWKDWFLRRTGGWMLRFRCFEHEFRGFHRWFPCTEEDQQVFGRFNPPNLRLKALVTHWSWHIQYQCNRFLYFKLGPARRLGPRRKQPVPIKPNTWTSSNKFPWTIQVVPLPPKINSFSVLQADIELAIPRGGQHKGFRAWLSEPQVIRDADGSPFSWTFWMDTALRSYGSSVPTLWAAILLPAWAPKIWALGSTAAGVGIVLHTSRNKVLDTAAHTNTLVIDMCLLPSVVNHDVNDSFFTKRVSTWTSQSHEDPQQSTLSHGAEVASPRDAIQWFLAEKMGAGARRCGLSRVGNMRPFPHLVSPGSHLKLQISSFSCTHILIQTYWNLQVLKFIPYPKQYIVCTYIYMYHTYIYMYMYIIHI